MRSWFKVNKPLFVTIDLIKRLSTSQSKVYKTLIPSQFYAYFGIKPLPSFKLWDRG